MTNRQIKDVVSQSLGRYPKNRRCAQSGVSGVNVVTGTFDIYDFDQSRGTLPVLYMSLTLISCQRSVKTNQE
jgi:hypothetical protein